MKILVIHNSYQLRGGEDAVAQNEIELLRVHGNVVKTWFVSNNSINGWIGKIIAAVGTIFSLPSFVKALIVIRDARPDVVHVHNFFPLISPSVFYACHWAGVPVVFTLHNFRILCPTALLMHDNVVTERSLHEGPWWAVREKVYRDSMLGTLALAMMIWVHKFFGTWSTKVTRFIALTRFSAAKFATAGVPSDRIAVKSNFVDVAIPNPSDRSGLLFVGRLSREKGIDILTRAVNLIYDGEVFMKVAGAGPLADEVSSVAGIKSLGRLDTASVHQEMVLAQALVMPSICYEGFPLVLVEAYACGLPVIASRLGAMAELVEDGVTGLLFEPGSAEDLARKMAWAIEYPAEMRRMGAAARKRYEMLYTPECNYEQLMAIYSNAINSRGHVGRKE